MWAKQIFVVQDQSNPELLSGGGSNDGGNGGDDAEGDDIDNDGNDQAKHCSIQSSRHPIKKELFIALLLKS